MTAHKNQVSFGRWIFAVTALALSLSACTKTKETKSTVSPDAYVTKADYEGKTFSLVRGVEESDSNNTIGATPGMSQDFGFVKVRITETEIQFIELFNLENKTETQSILASFPIKDHFDIQREVNDFGESTHKIVENKERPWNQRAYMRVDWSAPTNEKSKLATSTWTADAPTENAVLLQSPKNENGHISWLTEFSAAGGVFWWGDVKSNSRVVVRTHLMPVKATDFQPLNYRSEDFKRFGYFYTRQNFENPEKGLLDSDLEDHTFANVHNVCEPNRTDDSGKPLSCSTNKIVWRVTKNFPQKYRDVTRRVIAEWNETFKQALGRQDDVVVLDETAEVDMVDPRYNTIAYYGEKSSGGLLGVAQETINPQTGETIASRATVYQDGIASLMGLVDDIVTLILSDETVRQAFLATDAETKERVESIFKPKERFELTAMSRADRKNTIMSRLGLKAVGRLAKKTVRQSKSTTLSSAFVLPRPVDAASEINRMVRETVVKMKEPMASSIARKQMLMTKAPHLFAIADQAALGNLASYDETFGLLGATKPVKSRLPELAGLEHLHDLGSSLREERARMINQASSGVHGAELVEEAALRYIRKVLAEHPEAQDFKAQVDILKRDVEQKTFYTTLLHEMGHTFGLRHNFQGSADAKHYPPEYFRLVKQMEKEKDLPDDKKTVTEADLQPYMFSSIMDYGGDFYSQLGGIGPYDKAAIRYAYNRSIDKQKDAVVLANYQFCTDHQVNESILCRRFDKGRNVSEITFNAIESYHTNWVLSHYRRNRANFERAARSYPMRILTRTFVPVRQVMDEFLFALVDAKTVPAKDGECSMAYWRSSVDKGEIANVCNPSEAEQAGVDPTSLDTFEAGLFTESGLRKNPVDYEPYGLADLLFANILAKQFFTEVLGSTEPGQYVAFPVAKNVFELQPLPAGKDLDEAVATFASERDLPTTPEVLGQIKNLVGEVKVGRYGKPLNSEWDETTTDPKQKNIGAFWDKYMAMITLGFKDIGVDKYARRSMTGNAYVFPHTTAFTQSIIRSMIVQKDRLVTVPFVTKAGVIPASALPSLDINVRSIATITALTDFISDTDKTSMPDRMRICSANEKGCEPKFGKLVEFTTSSGQNVYRTAQLESGDSIAFDLLTEAAALDKKRNEWFEKKRTASDSTAQNIMTLTELAPSRETLEKKLLSLNIKELSDITPVLLSNDPKKASMWNIVNLVVTQADGVPLFTTINLVQQSGNVLNATAQILGASIEALDPKNQCPDPKPATPPAASAEETKKLPAVVGLSAILAGNAAGASNAAKPKNEGGATAVDCAPILARRAEIVAVATEFQAFATRIGGILNSSVEAKVAPLQLERATDELKRAENNILLIREVSKAVGLE